MSLTKPQLIIVAAAGAIVLILILIVLGVLPGLKNTANDPTKVVASLKFWGVGDTADAYSGALAAFKAVYPNVAITYRGFANDTDYESSLLDALASNQGPDIFMIRNTDLPKNLNKITAIPQAQLSVAQLNQYFPRVVAQDFSYQNSVYALPLSVDTLALIYNRSLFDQAAVPLPVNWQGWDDFVNAVPKLVKHDSGGQIVQAAAALGGGSDNIDNANDIFYLLMLQSGGKISDSQTGTITLNSNAGAQALNFYTQFSNPNSQSYTWDSSMPDSLDAFSEGKVAMIFIYASELPQIKSRNSFLNFDIAPMLQPNNASSSIDYPGYYGYVVSHQSKNQSLAWNFITSMTMNSAAAKTYAQATQKPPALNSLIYQYQNDPVLGVFSKQALVAQSWYQFDSDYINQSISGMINSVVSGRSQTVNALSQTQDQINQYLKQKSS